MESRNLAFADSTESTFLRKRSAMDENSMSNKRYKTINGYTKINAISLRYNWTIENFLVNGKKTGEFLLSPTFSDSEESVYKWHIALYPKGREKQNAKYLSIFLFLEDHPKFTPVEANFDFSIIDEENNQKNKVNSLYYYQSPDGYGVDTFIKLESLMNGHYFFKTNLTICCEVSGGMYVEHLENQTDVFTNQLISVMPDSGSMKNQIKKEKEEDKEISSESIILKSLESMFYNQQLCDVTLITSETQFQAHKAILGAQSPVFLAMFEHDKEENEASELKLNYVKSNAVKEFLRFIYCGKISNLTDLIKDLFELANKFAVDALRFKCEEYLFSTVDVNNVVEVISLADRYNSIKLRKKAIKFLIQHKNEFTKEDKLAIIRTLHPDTVFEIIETIF